MYAPGPRASGAARKDKLDFEGRRRLLTEGDGLSQSGRRLRLDLADRWVHVFVTDCEVIRSTTALKCLASDRVE